MIVFGGLVAHPNNAAAFHPSNDVSENFRVSINISRNVLFVRSNRAAVGVQS